MNVSYTSREQVEVYKFPWFVSIGAPLFLVVLQAFLPTRVRFFGMVDLPLLVTIFFAVSRRNPVSGLMTGAMIGLAQDSLTHMPLGVYGIAKTLVGFTASSLGVRIDVENPGTRFLMTFAFYLGHGAIYVLLMRGLAGQPMAFRWPHEALAALVNATIGIGIYNVLDRFKLRD